ncbi:flagellar biosynthesis sigma factor [Burkholderia ubonensis]|uniref:hypothetical protein n=1 Tax=Burkholderia ubonensis TaxID=101571 RepID=UPI000756453A|nr:hypothetical protein [Burkholderia ubonensis]KVD58222.1 flagellar biosynthesis sigma factor [Burkholderia ubonensis]KVD62853.1 flagellar biosynthesis sigma factor [Burkholderia ubonensis]KVD69190.1 flagellar biosynthesis sigma factor [Burkholderia ubonensis]KVG84816.1 flagellar biosynthesis sigma factor [Burkholderia ubonensis]KVO61791.1 flagellar biosynthesis sigma factor [Burkholderia ubonensis]
MAIRKIGWRWRIVGAVLALLVMWELYVAIRPADEVVLAIGESYEQVRQRSRSTLPAATPEAFWAAYVSRPARLRFIDPQYGFVTPAAKFLTVGYDEHGIVWGVTLSPQTETLPLDETMAILLDLQDQLSRGDWQPIRVAQHPPMTDTPETRALMRANLVPQTFWLAGDKYQVSIEVRRFIHESRPDDERYLITLQLSGPPLMEDRPGE